MLYQNLLILLFLLGYALGRVSVTTSNFPVDLGNSIHMRVDQVQDGETVRVTLDEVVKVIIKYNHEKTYSQFKFKCRQVAMDSFDVTFTPVREDYMKLLRVEYFKDLSSLELSQPEYLLDRKVEITFHSDKHILPLTLDRRETEFNNGDRFQSEGSLPPKNISINLKCRPRSPAIIESTRLKLAKKNAPYELYFPNFDFDTETNPDKFATIVADYDAHEEIKDKVIPPGDKEVTAHFTASRRLDQCQITCSQDKAEVISEDISVKYPTEHAFILPRPENGFLRAGDTIGCYADGNPPPAVRLEAFIPKLREDIVTDEHLNFMENHKTVPPIFGTKGILINPNIGTIQYNDTEAFYNQFYPTINKLRGHLRFIPIVKDTAEDFAIRGSQLYISPNATIGKEVIAICYATRVEVHSRFIITYRYNASLGVVLGICAGMLFLSVVILSLMIIMKRRQKQTSTAYQARKKNQGFQGDQNVAKKPPHPGPKSARTSERDYDLHNVNSNLIPSKHHTPSRILDNVCESPYELTLNSYQENANHGDYMSTFTRNAKHHQGLDENSNIQSIEENVEKHYATLDFNETLPAQHNQFVDRTPVHGAGIRSNSLVGGPTQPSHNRRNLSKSAATSSTTLFGAINKMPPRSITGGSGGGQIQENPIRLYDPDNQDDGKMTDVIAVLRPKESSLNGVEAQQYEYLQSLLEMKRKKDSEFV